MPPAATTVTSSIGDLLLGESAAMAAVREQVIASLEGDQPLLLVGERGTGRERVARVLHETGPRRARGFGRLTGEGRSEPAAVERELERASGGTLLVKDIARVGRGPQRKILKALRARGGDVRLVGATGVDLSRAVADELFDAELFERLGAQRIELPPLRKRAEDVAPLAIRFVREAAEEMGRGRLHLASRALDRLRSYVWPGNIAELKDVVVRAAFRARRSAVELADVEAELPRVEDRVPLEQLSFEEMVRAKISGLLERMEGYPIEDLYDEVIARVERPLIELVLQRAQGNQLRAARMLGLNRNTLRKKIAERGLPATPVQRKRRR